MAMLYSILHNQGETTVLLVLPVMAPLLRKAMAPVAHPVPLPLNNKLHAWLTDVKATNQGDDNLER